jgi:hypothetical protein
LAKKKRDASFAGSENRRRRRRKKENAYLINKTIFKYHDDACQNHCIIQIGNNTGG